ncbi:MAG: SDR family oxidoreductase [Myxococcales bacterium]
MSFGPRSTILVTGANGLVGSRVVARLARGQNAVVATGRGPRRQSLGELPGIEYVETDLSRPGSLRELVERVGPGAVIHCGALTDVDACEADPPRAWTVNVSGTAEAALGARAVEARLVALSTDYVFDGDAGRSYWEEDRPNPRGAYARTKRAAEEAALLLGGNAAVARVALVYSGRKGSRPTFAATAADALLAGKEVKAFVDQTGSPTLADNAAEMVIGLLHSAEKGIWHCSGASAVTRFEFARALARTLGADENMVVGVPLASVGLVAPRPRNSSLRVDKIRRLLGSSVPLDLPAQLERFARERAG